MAEIWYSKITSFSKSNYHISKFCMCSIDSMPHIRYITLEINDVLKDTLWDFYYFGICWVVTKSCLRVKQWHQIAISTPAGTVGIGGDYSLPRINLLLACLLRHFVTFSWDFDGSLLHSRGKFKARNWASSIEPETQDSVGLISIQGRHSRMINSHQGI